MTGVEYDPFNELETREDDFARARPVNTLEPGKAYKLVHFSQMKSQWPDADRNFPINTIVQYFDESLKFQGILPRKFNNKEVRWIEAMNKLIKNNAGPKLVYYGTVSLGYEVEILRHTQEPSLQKLEIVQKIQAQTTPKKNDSGGKGSINSNREATGTPAKRSLSMDDGPPTKRN